MQWHSIIAEQQHYGEGERVLQMPFFGEVLDFPWLPSAAGDQGTLQQQVQYHANGLPAEALALARVGLMPHVWTLWELLQRGQFTRVISADVENPEPLNPG